MLILGFCFRKLHGIPFELGCSLLCDIFVFRHKKHEHLQHFFPGRRADAFDFHNVLIQATKIDSLAPMLPFPLARNVLSHARGLTGPTLQ